ncbi:hypothetical protein llap_2724 [Limosa lapponica baueri]|uniref:Uncharacterized protein n=1 Tax=Limosa lapponica baueri TaxID=1758121 RepID=A0A2I0ULT0_LIMLA|nr:hypothetical protein llap_2724 [Limosa lapponica baueri]
MASPRLETYCCPNRDAATQLVMSFQPDVFCGVCIGSASVSLLLTILQLLPKKGQSPRKMPKASSSSTILLLISVCDILGGLVASLLKGRQGIYTENERRLGTEIQIRFFKIMLGVLNPMQGFLFTLAFYGWTGWRVDLKWRKREIPWESMSSSTVGENAYPSPVNYQSNIHDSKKISTTDSQQTDEAISMLSEVWIQFDPYMYLSNRIMTLGQLSMKRKHRDLEADYIDPFETETTFLLQHSSQLGSKDKKKVEVELLVNREDILSIMKSIDAVRVYGLHLTLSVAVALFYGHTALQFTSRMQLFLWNSNM